MSAAADLIPAQPYSSWVLWLGLFLLIGSGALAGWLRISTRIPPAPRQLLAPKYVGMVSLRERRLLESQLDRIQARVAGGEVSPAAAHLEVAAVLRALGTFASGRNLEVATFDEITRTMRMAWPQYLAVLQTCQEPSFAPAAAPPIEDTLARTRALVLSVSPPDPQVSDGAQFWRDWWGRLCRRPQGPPGGGAP